MKKLFRTSKSTVDPLPPPSLPNSAPPSATDARSPPPPPGKKGFQAFMGGGGNVNNGTHHHHHNNAHEPPHEHSNTNANTNTSKWGFLGGPEKVTPFPIDMGRDHQPPNSGGMLKKKEKTKVPTLQEMQSPDWRNSNGHAHGYDTPPSAGHPYLPPGARPPSPPPALRPNTPTRYPYTSTPSQSSQTSVHREPIPVPVSGIGRDRGYSSASDSEPPVPLPKMAPIRSPLAYHPPPPPMDQYASPPHQHQQMPQPQPHSHPTQHQQQFAQNHPQHNRDAHNEQSWTSGHDDIHRDREEPKEKKKFWGVAWGDKKDKHREKDRDGANSNRELARPVMAVEDRRPSFEGWRGENESTGHGSTGHHSHHSQSLTHSNYGQHMQMSQSQAGHHDGYTGIESAENVTQAIDILVRDPDPPMSSIYAVCDRVNQSQTPDSICKEAAKALRRHFKHGNEGERRAAAKIWLIMMRNIGNEVFRHQAGSKKFMSPLETVLLAPPNKAVVSSATHRLLTEILADLTYMYGGEKGCEGLHDLWKKVKMPQEPEMGQPLPPKHHLYASDNLPRPEYSTPASRRGSEPMQDQNQRSKTPDLRYTGPAYAALPNHSDDIRRLIEECIAAKESARVLTEALVFTRPEDLPSKPIIKEFYRKCFMAHESLTNQMDWAQAEASRSREMVNVQRLMTTDSEQDVRSQTMEEEALGSLFEAHSALAEGIRQHDELERMAQDEVELRQVRERSRKETRMDRNELLLPQVRGSGSRSPSPAPHSRLPDPRQIDGTLPEPRYPHDSGRSRTPSPDHFAHPKISTSPARAASPLSKAKGPRPLPDPMKRTNLSNPALNSASVAPVGQGQGEQRDDDAVPFKPSRKALGKRRAVIDEDNDFDPDDMFNGPKEKSSASSEESTVEDFSTPGPTVKYAYDAYEEKLQKLKAAGGGMGSGTRDVPVKPRPGTEAHRA